MEKPKVTIQEAAAAYLAGGDCIVFSLIMLIPALSGPENEKVAGCIMASIFFAFGLLALGLADSKYVIDENGIYYKGFIKEYRYPWPDVIEVGVAKVHNRKGIGTYHPEIWIMLKGGTPKQAAGDLWIVRNMSTGIQLPYRRKVWNLHPLLLRRA